MPTSCDCLRKASQANTAVARARTARARVATAVRMVAPSRDMTEAYAPAPQRRRGYASGFRAPRGSRSHLFPAASVNVMLTV